MSLIEQIIGEAKANNIFLYVRDGQLAFIAEKGGFPSDLKAKISKYKKEITTSLLQMQQPSSEVAPFSLLTDDERKVIVGQGYEDAYPLSALQAGMIFHVQLGRFSGVYHDIMAKYVVCPWNRDCFAQAIAECIQEQPILRTGFRLTGERPLQHVHATMATPLEVQDLRHLSAEEQDQYIKRWKAEYTHFVFDWDKGPLFHVHIFLRTDDSFEFVLSFHHAVLDGWSRAALETMLYNRYLRLLRGEQPEPIKVDWTYREFIALEQQVLNNPSAKAYFMSMLEDAPTEQLPRTKNPKAERTQKDAVVEPVLGMSGGLIEVAKQLGVPVQSVLLAAHYKVLSTVSGRSRVVSCVTHNGRPERADAERGLGLFLNGLPVCLDLGSGTWRDLIKHVAKTVTASLEYRRYPLARIQQDTGWLFDEVIFDYTHFHVYNELTVNAAQPLELLGNTMFAESNFNLVIDSSRGTNDNTIEFALRYNSQVLDDDFVARLSSYYANSFRLMLDSVDQPHTAQ